MVPDASWLIRKRENLSQGIHRIDDVRVNWLDELFCIDAIELRFQKLPNRKFSFFQIGNKLVIELIAHFKVSRKESIMLLNIDTNPPQSTVFN